jgi:hypothetical protein
MATVLMLPHEGSRAEKETNLRCIIFANDDSEAGLRQISYKNFTTAILHHRLGYPEVYGYLGLCKI